MLSESQLKQRRTGISASDVAAIIGEHPWKKPIDIYLQKTEEQQHQEPDSEAVALGHFMERHLSNLYCDRAPEGTTRQIYEPRRTVRNEDEPWIMATPDRYVWEGREKLSISKRSREVMDGKASHLLEVKLVGPRVMRAWSTSDDQSDEDAVPVYVLTQVQWQMLATGYKRVDVVALLGGTSLRTYTIHRDDSMLVYLKTICEDFWKNNVQKRVPPDPDGSVAYGRYLSTVYHSSSGSVVETDNDEVIRAAVNYANINRQISELEKQKELEGQKLKAAIGELAALYGSWGKVGWTEGKGRIDYKSLAADLDISEETLEKYRKPSRTFRVNVKALKE